MNRNGLREAAAAVQIQLSEPQLDLFEGFEAALYAANETRNLTRISQDECWLRHFVDSLLCADLFPSDADLLDLGTGPGFPAWPLAAARPDLHILAVDSNQKMLSFLESQPLPNLHTQLARAEELNEPEHFDIVTGRAVAPLATQLEISCSSCRVDGLIIPMRTPRDEPFPRNIQSLRLKLEAVVNRELPLNGGSRAFPIYRKTGPQLVPKRSWAEMKRRPLFDAE